MKPSDLLIGLRELFGSLIPGAIFLICLAPASAAGLADLLAPGHELLAGKDTGLLGFFFASFVVGTLLMGSGSVLDKITDKWAWPFDIGGDPDDAERERNIEMLAGRLRDHAMQSIPVEVTGSIWGKRGFWWNYLRVHCPLGVGEIDRLEAQQKLFRSLVAAFLILTAIDLAAFATLAVQPSPVRLAALLSTSLICFLPYWQMRRKLTERLYQLAVIQFVGDDLHIARASAAKT